MEWKSTRTKSIWQVRQVALWELHMVLNIGSHICTGVYMVTPAKGAQKGRNPVTHTAPELETCSTARFATNFPVDEKKTTFSFCLLTGRKKRMKLGCTRIWFHLHWHHLCGCSGMEKRAQGKLTQISEPEVQRLGDSPKVSLQLILKSRFSIPSDSASPLHSPSPNKFLANEFIIFTQHKHTHNIHIHMQMYI